MPFSAPLYPERRFTQGDPTQSSSIRLNPEFTQNAPKPLCIPCKTRRRPPTASLCSRMYASARVRTRAPAGRRDDAASAAPKKRPSKTRRSDALFFCLFSRQTECPGLRTFLFPGCVRRIGAEHRQKKAGASGPGAHLLSSFLLGFLPFGRVPFCFFVHPLCQAASAVFSSAAAFIACLMSPVSTPHASAATAGI